MKKIVNSILFILVFFAISVAFADQSPESIVSCAANGYLVGAQSIYGAVNAELCTQGEDACATCIGSLEDQGCKIIDVVPITLRYVEELDDLLTVTYLLSCDPR